MVGADGPPGDDGALRRLLDDLYARERRFVALDPGATARTLDALGRPERAYVCVQVAGTNGKGSTSAMVARGLVAAGLRVGLFTSPHLEDWRERVRTGPALEPIAEAEALSAVRVALEAGARAGATLTFFEVTTVAALVAFARAPAPVDVAVLEVGLGGRLDATSAVACAAGAIVTIDHDHGEVLGPDLASIAREKAGIARAGEPIVSGVDGAGGAQQSAARDAVRAEVAARGARLLELGTDFAWEEGEARWRGTRWSFDGLVPAMAGAHQRHNAAVALALLEALDARVPALGLDARRDAVATAALGARWPARFETLQWPGGPLVVLDAAHNAAGARALARTIRDELPGRRVHLVFGALADKDLAHMLAPLVDVADEATFTRPPGKRAHEPADIAAAAARLRPDLPARATGEAPAARVALDVVRAAAPDDVVVVCGSIYLLAEVRPALLAQSSTRAPRPG